MDPNKSNVATTFIINIHKPKYFTNFVAALADGELNGSGMATLSVSHSGLEMTARSSVHNSAAHLAFKTTGFFFFEPIRHKSVQVSDIVSGLTNNLPRRLSVYHVRGSNELSFYVVETDGSCRNFSVQFFEEEAESFFPSIEYGRVGVLTHVDMIRLTSKADQDKNAEVLWARKWENWQNAKPIVCRVIGARPSENENKKVLVWLPSDFWIYPTALKKAYTLGSKIRLMELEKPGLSMCLCIIAPEGYVTFILPPVL